MRATINEPILDENIQDNSTNTNNGSQIVEPEILIPINPTNTPPVYTPPIKGTQNVEDVENGLPQGTTVHQNTVNSNQTNTGNSTVTNPNATPSATTDSTKNYVNGGTTPDSNIIVKKPKPNYLVYGLIGLVGAYVVFKMFFNKKTE